MSTSTMTFSALCRSAKCSVCTISTRGRMLNRCARSMLCSSCHRTVSCAIGPNHRSILSTASIDAAAAASSTGCPLQLSLSFAFTAVRMVTGSILYSSSLFERSIPASTSLLWIVGQSCLSSISAHTIMFAYRSSIPEPPTVLAGGLMDSDAEKAVSFCRKMGAECRIAAAGDAACCKGPDVRRSAHARPTVKSGKPGTYAPNVIEMRASTASTDLAMSLDTLCAATLQSELSMSRRTFCRCELSSRISFSPGSGTCLLADGPGCAGIGPLCLIHCSIRRSDASSSLSASISAYSFAVAATCRSIFLNRFAAPL
ncbi:Os03g0270600 [Oryza sativa Japonica Group]|uniref:Os03g0270600 protein n=1 Tax=Oryza sativa subsp. japonica TaxID=39947 RepID=A0A0P0VVY7_ORYSJ|nr:hypothetical protein EE612_016715 [Oryza sativa]BAS83470.1 Os03g0270600 [Oryza sativa Japonica Group]